VSVTVDVLLVGTGILVWPMHLLALGWLSIACRFEAWDDRAYYDVYPERHPRAIDARNEEANR
jgi:hypothetical protein